MKYKSFPHEFWQLINSTIDQLLAEGGKTPMAAFDADGTLWNTDLGEQFFKWQIESGFLKNLPVDPWKHYVEWKAKGDPRPPYRWLAQINKGQPIEQVRAWAKQCVEENSPTPIFEDQKKLVELLQTRGIPVYVVTASIKWAVEPGAALLGIPQENVLGVQTKVQDGIVTDVQAGEITYREGKAIALENLTGQKPFLSSGNTLGDIALLQAATKIKLCVSAAKKDHRLWKSEEELRIEAKKNGWLIHEF